MSLTRQREKDFSRKNKEIYTNRSRSRSRSRAESHSSSKYSNRKERDAKRERYTSISTEDRRRIRGEPYFRHKLDGDFCKHSTRSSPSLSPHNRHRRSCSTDSSGRREKRRDRLDKKMNIKSTEQDRFEYELKRKNKNKERKKLQKYKLEEKTRSRVHKGRSPLSSASSSPVSRTSRSSLSSSNPNSAKHSSRSSSTESRKQLKTHKKFKTKEERNSSSFKYSKELDEHRDKKNIKSNILNHDEVKSAEKKVEYEKKQSNGAALLHFHSFTQTLANTVPSSSLHSNEVSNKTENSINVSEILRSIDIPKEIRNNPQKAADFQMEQLRKKVKIPEFTVV
jgi:hypothetical protein